MSYISSKEQQEIKAKVIKLRSTGFDGCSKEVVNQLSKEYPELTADHIERIENDPYFLKSVVEETLRRNSGRLSEVIKTTLAKAVSGDAKHTKILIKLLGMDNKNVNVSGGNDADVEGIKNKTAQEVWDSIPPVEI